MALGNIVKRLMVAFIAIPFVIYAIIKPEIMIGITAVLSFAGMREFILIRSSALRHLYSAPKVDEQGKAVEYPLPPKPTSAGDKLQIIIRCSLSVLITISAYFCSNEASPSFAGTATDKSNILAFLQSNVHSSVAVLFVTIVIISLFFVLCMFEVLHTGDLAKDPAHVNPQVLAKEDFMGVFIDIFGFIWVGGGLAGALIITRMTKVFMCLICLANWASDSMALTFGKTMGRHKLCPKLSPNKTVEGAFGSVFGAVAASFIYRQILVTLVQYDIATIVIPETNAFLYNGIIIGIFAIVGDLVKSYMKRVAYVKDSGQFFGAHGGVLDRIDGLLFTFPILYFFVLFGWF